MLAVALLLALGALAGCGGDEESAPPAATETEEPEIDAPEEEPEETDMGTADGAAVFAEAGCGSCHALAAADASGSVGPDLDEVSLDVDEVARQVREGGGAMPAFSDQLSDAEIEAVAAYVVESSESS